MKKALIFCVFGAICPPSPALSLGDDGHMLVLERAISLLSPELREFHEAEWKEIKGQVLAPDRRAGVPEEACKHYLDVEKLDSDYVSRLRIHLLENLGDQGYVTEEGRYEAGIFDSSFFKRRTPPWSKAETDVLWKGLPRNAAGFSGDYGPIEPFIGSVVYQPALYCRALSRAVARNDRRAILRYTGYLAHYAADLNVPLHLTANYKGQYSGNRKYANRKYGDLHARFDTAFVAARLPVLTNKLRQTQRVPVDYASMADITSASITKAREAYGRAARVIEADLAACRAASPARDWEAYVEKVRPVFEPALVEGMASAAAMTADLIEAARSGRLESALRAGKMDR